LLSLVGLITLCGVSCSSGGDSPNGDGGSANRDGGKAGGGGSTSTGGAGGTMGPPDGTPCTITGTAPNQQCENNCTDSVDPVTCLSLCHDMTTKTPGTTCGGKCVDTSQDHANCGACGKVCDGICAASVCKLFCEGADASARTAIESACTTA